MQILKSKPPNCSPAAMDPRGSLGYLIRRCGSLMTIIADEAFQETPLTFTQGLVLMSLCAHDSRMSPTRLCEEAAYDSGAMTRVIDDLERHGYVRRERNGRDRRTIEIVLTDAGRCEAESSVGLIENLLNELAEPFSTTEMDRLVSLLQRLHLRLRERIHLRREVQRTMRGRGRGS